MSYTHRGYTIRTDMLRALEAYVQLGVPLGDFLQNVVSNNLVHAAGHADSDNFANLQAYAGWLYNECPMDACGSREKYLAWIEKKATERQAYFDLLATHPWGWQESDDERTWLAGKGKDELLCRLRSSIDPDHSIWNRAAPAGHKVPPFAR